MVFPCLETPYRAFTRALRSLQTVCVSLKTIVFGLKTIDGSLQTETSSIPAAWAARRALVNAEEAASQTEAVDTEQLEGYRERLV